LKRGGALLAVLGLLLGAAGCDTVSLGSPPADVNLCEPSQTYFVQQIWPNFLGMAYNGKHCFDSSCHGPGSSAPMSLTDITAKVAALPQAPNPVPLPLDPEIFADYTQATQRMNCADPLDSDLLAYPENVHTHGGGMLIMPTGPEATLVQMWITAP
jgi:hypothetical protein